jgi:hypothetical protein
MLEMVIMGLVVTPQSRRREGVVTGSEMEQRGGEGLGRIAMGWLRFRRGVLEVDWGRRVDVEGS